jgi:peroxiredoxin
MRFPGAFVVAVGLASLSACHEEKAVVAPERTVVAGPASSVPVEERGLGVGSKVPTFRLERLDGRGKVGLPNGKVTILAFIATWNEPAKKMLTPLQTIHAEYAGRGIEVIAISVDDEVDGVRAFGETHGATFPVAWDAGHAVAARLRPPSMPTAYVVDRGGTLRFASFGYHDGDGETLAREAASLL